MDNCYVCGKELSDDGLNETVKRHSEHIIHNGIYGKLKSSSILCEKCGGLYSEKDAQFVKIFDCFTEVIRKTLVQKDHGKTNKSKRLQGYFYNKNGNKVDVEYKEGRVYPKNPYYENDKEENVVKIFAEEKRGENYKNQIIKDNPMFSDYKFEFCNDISSDGCYGLFFSEKNQNFNTSFKYGICKIATEFALHCNVDTEELPYTLRKKSNNSFELISDDVFVAPYMPQSIIECIVEYIDDYVNENYPMHILRLYSEYGENNHSRNLICYIELFSTFKYYVLLNTCYKGKDIDEVYCQTLISSINNNGGRLDIKNYIESKKNKVYEIFREYLNTKKIPEIIFKQEKVISFMEEAIFNEGVNNIICELNDYLNHDNYMKKIVLYYDDVQPVILSLFQKIKNVKDEIIRIYTFDKFYQLNRFSFNYEEIIKARCNCI